MIRDADGALDDEATRDAVLTALGAEHAAIWSYGLCSAFLTTDAALTDAAQTHRRRRDAVLALLEPAGVVAPPAAAGYRPPTPVTDAASAAALLVAAEEDVAAAWHAVCERTEAADGAALRSLGVDALVTSAGVGVGWRRAAGSTPLVSTFPGIAI